LVSFYKQTGATTHQAITGQNPAMQEKNGKIPVLNNLKISECPCCKSTSFSQIGTVNYPKNPCFSSLQITLTNIPELWACNLCKSRFIQNRVSEFQSIDLYSQGNSWYYKSTFEDLKSAETVRLLDSLLSPNSKLLDIGCANGTFLDYANKRNVLTYGLEYSRSHRQELQLKKHVAYSDWSQIDTCFEIITAFDVIEHLYDLPAFLDCCFRHLEDNGLLVLVTGDIDSWSAQKGGAMWWYVRYAEHILFPSLNYFKSLKNWQVMTAIKTHPGRFFVPQLSLKILKTIKNVVLNLFILSEFPIFPFTEADHMLIVLRKRKVKVEAALY
jgi:2-polyprenyl-3-methyl-5-hydroxy-6-metoxy-1,4-benzoquinol methylase